MLTSPSAIDSSPSVRVVVQLNGGCVGLCVAPVFGSGPPLHIVLVPLASPILFSSLRFSHCRVRCYSIVGLGVCLCGRVVSLWNSGDGLCVVEGRVVSTVHCQLFMCYGVRFSVLCCVVLLCCLVVLWNGGGVRVCGLVACLPFPLPFCVGVRGSARAALRARTLSPNTIAFPLLCSLFFSAPRLSLRPAFPVVVEWRCVIHHVSVCCVGMTAMGSLSRSSSFFW